MKKITLLLSAMLFAMMSFAATTVTMDFTSQAGLEKLGIAYPVDSTTTEGAFQTELVAGQAYTQEGVSLTATHGSTPTRVWLAASGALDLRHYKTGVLTFAAPAGKVILKVKMSGGSVAGFADAPGGVWTGEANSVALTADESAKTMKINTIEVTYGDAGEDIGGNEGGGTNPGETSLVIPDEAKGWDIPAGAIDVLQAREICAGLADKATSGTKYYVMGYVKKLHEKYHESGVSGYGNATFYMENVKGAGSMDDFLAFQVYGPNGQKITDPNVVAEGDFVVVYGELTNFGGTYETTGKGSAYIWNSTNPLIGSTTPPTPPTPPTDLVGDGTVDNPYTVEDILALNNSVTGSKYVKGYIIGQVNGMSISTGLDSEAPFAGDDGKAYHTNIVIASTMGETSKIVPVQLPSGDLRKAFNLVENPDMHGVEVLICGDLLAYFGVAGIRNTISIEVIGGGNPNVVNVTGLQYADAYYYEEEGVGYYEIDLYKDMDPDTYEYVYPELYLAVEAKSKTALNGTYELLYAGLWTSVNDSVEIGDAVGTVTIKNKDDNNNYSFVGSYVGTDGKTYKFNQVVNVLAAYDVDADYEEIELKEETETPPTPPTSMITCADAAKIAAAENYKGTENVTVYGYVVELGSQKVDDNSGRNKQTFWLSDENGGEKQFQAYWAYVPDFFQVGDKVAVTGILQNYKGTIEIADGEATLLGTTDVDNVTVGATPVKVIENGQLMIIRGEKVYNVLGAQVK